MKPFICSSKILVLSIGLLGFVPTASPAANAAPVAEKKIGVLLVNHGSRSATWRQALLDLEQSVRPTLLTNQSIQGIKTAFMEYTEPSIATRLKEFDADGCTDIVIVPVFLTVSPHTFDDIPTIIGRKIDPHSFELLKLEKIERYKPKANTVITPNLDFTDVLKKNVLRRVKSLATTPAEEGLVMIAYGDATYEREWASLLDTVGGYVKQNTGIDTQSRGWCGHVAHYDPKMTTEAIEKVLETKKRAVVIPVLVAHDEMFQIKIIGDGIAKVPDYKARVVYRPDSILPDASVEKWVIDITGQFVAKIQAQQRSASTR
jgi:hypothetical protein